LKKVLVVTYYWPPAGGPGVQRVLKFVKYLPEFGWQPIVLTVRDGEYPAIDETLNEEIPDECLEYSTVSLEPGHLYKKFVGMSQGSNIPNAILADEEVSVRQRISNIIRLNLFIPDAKIGWKPFAIKKGKELLQKQRPDIILSSSPPPTTHLIARRLAKHGGIPWIADFRDPWTEIHYYENQPRLKIAQKIDHHLEKEVLETATRITCISQQDIEKDFGTKVSPDKCRNIPNGYDEDDFQSIHFQAQPGDKFIMMHLGSVGSERNPVNLFQAISILAKEENVTPETFTVEFVGPVEESVVSSMEQFGIEQFVKLVPYLPHHEALKKMQSASALLLLVTQSEQNERILPGKTFEYMRAGKPLFALGPEKGEVAYILQQYESGAICDYSKLQNITNHLRHLFLQWKNQGQLQNKISGQVERFSRRNLTGELSKLFDECIATNE